jgi:tetratricopeptide (TPR) repeat protein
MRRTVAPGALPTNRQLRYLTDMLDLALQHYKAGRFAEAAACCGKILNQSPRDFHALHLLGRVRMSEHQFDQAAYFLTAALGLAPPDDAAVGVLSDLAAAELAQRHVDSAVDCFRRILAIRPADPATLQRLGNALYDAGRIDEAIATYRLGVEAAPNSAGIFNNLGNAMRAAGLLEEAVVAYRSAVSLRPDHVLLQNNLGQALYMLDRNDEAAECHRRALAISPDDPDALIGLGNALRKGKQPGVAERAFEQACDHYLHALRIRPDDVSAQIGVGNALLGLFRHAEAVPYLERALAQRPEDNDTRIALGNALLGANRNVEALAQYREAEKHTTDTAPLRLNQALALLTIGGWSEGWELMESRFSVPQAFPGLELPRDVRFWRGEDIAGKTILLQGEQGLGDTIHLVRYAPMVAARGATVVLRVQPMLGKLLGGMRGVDIVLTGFDPAPAVDAVCPLMSLPRAFDTDLATVPAQVPYLTVPESYRMLWRTLLGERRRPRVGVAWRGQQHLPHRSMPLAQLAPLLQRADYEFHGLQKEITDSDREWLAAHKLLIDHSDELSDFADTAAIAEAMDLVISIDTSVAHLAGALARPLWVMLPFAADFRWLLDRTDSPWYPTARLFRQGRAGDWSGVILAVAEALPRA